MSIMDSTIWCEFLTFFSIILKKHKAVKYNDMFVRLSARVIQGNRVKDNVQGQQLWFYQRVLSQKRAYTSHTM